MPLRRHFGTLFNRHRHFTTQKPDRSLIGPFNALPHFPAYGTPVWDLFPALAGNSVLPKAAREVVILASAAHIVNVEAPLEVSSEVRLFLNASH